MDWWKWDEPSNQHSAISQTFFTATDAKDAKDEYESWRDVDPQGKCESAFNVLTITTDLNLS